MVASYKRLNFKNYPLIATELVKFLAINMSLKAIEKLTPKAIVLELEIADFKKEIERSIKNSQFSSQQDG